MIMRRPIKKFFGHTVGSVAAETALVLPIMIVLAGAGIELSYCFYQWNGAVQAARSGARIAATYDPVAMHMRVMTGMEDGAEAGDPMPDYTLDCSGNTQSCSQGAYNALAMDAIVFGPDKDGACAATERKRRGMCDVFDEVRPGNVSVRYASSGFGRAGVPANPAPLVTVTVEGLKFDFVFLDLVAPQGVKEIPPVRVSQMGEDLQDG